MRDKIEQLQADIETGAAELVDGQDWQQWLRVAARFPKYSFRNTLLILMQRPDATAVMGYRAWQVLGHQVRRGETAIKILAPCLYKTKQDHDDGHDDDKPASEPTPRVLRGFRIAHVFALEQTDGDIVRPPAAPELLAGEAPSGLWDALSAQIRTEGFGLERAEIPSGANGTTNYATKTVTIAAQLSPAQAAKTLAHELGHVLLHDGTEYATGCRGRAEVEAESVAFVVCQAAGLRTEAYSFGYVAGWSGGDPKNVKATAERVVGCARQILDRAGLLDEPAPRRGPVLSTVDAVMKNGACERRRQRGCDGNLSALSEAIFPAYRL